MEEDFPGGRRGVGLAKVLSISGLSGYPDFRPPMKTLLILLVVGGLAAVGGAFFGLWTIPGLERMPTAEALGRERVEAREAEARQRVNGNGEAPPAGPLGANSDGALGKRSGQVRRSGESLGD